jgi:hypothetical protein
MKGMFLESCGQIPSAKGIKGTTLLSLAVGQSP